jgi:hypothetical protein
MNFSMNDLRETIYGSERTPTRSAFVDILAGVLDLDPDDELTRFLIAIYDESGNDWRAVRDTVKFCLDQYRKTSKWTSDDRSVDHPDVEGLYG